MTAFSHDIRPANDDDTFLHRALTQFNRTRLSPAFAETDWRKAIADETRGKLLEGRFVERERASIAPLLRDVPDEPEAFIAWYEDLRRTGPGQGDPLFPYLSETATLEQMRWFLKQEVAGEAGFEDLVALTQIKFPVQSKLELARNYWDEMGRGQEKGMHGPMLGRLAECLSLTPIPETVVWEALALGNLMIALASNRRYAYQSIGALGVIELTAPGRASYVAAGLKRLGVPPKSRIYYELHAVLDVKHSASWVEEVLRPLVLADRRTIPPIAEGALLRLRAGARCFDRYHVELGMDVPATNVA